MSLTRAKPGGWQIGERLTADQANHMDSQLPSAVDGAGGGTYTPSTAIVIGGSGIETTVTPTGADDVANKAYVDTVGATKVTAAIAIYSISGSGLSSGDKFTLTAGLQDSLFSVSSSEVTIAAQRKCRFDGHIAVTDSRTNNPQAIDFSLLVNGSTVMTFSGYRHNATASNIVVVPINWAQTLNAGDVVTLVAAGASGTQSASGGKLIIESAGN